MVILDSCTTVWLALDQTRLSKTARAFIERSEQLYVSAISALEIAQLHQKRRVRFHLTPAAWWAQALESHSLTELPVTGSIAAQSGMLPPIHRDPFDRLIIATALENDLTVLTSDDTLRSYPNLRSAW